MGIDPRLLVEHDFVNLRMALVEDLDGDFRAAIVMQRLFWRSERYPDGYPSSMQDLADDVHMSLRSTERAVSKLRDRGYLITSRIAKFDATTLFTIILGGVDPARMAEAPARMADSDTARMADSSYIDIRDNQETTPLTPQAVPPSTDVATLDPIDEAFERIWKLWPHHRSGRPKAMIAFRRALKAGVSLELVEAAVLRDCAVWDRWPKSEHQFVPHLTTWLNDSRWNADPPADRYSKPTTRDDIGAALADLRSRRGEPQEGIES